MRRTLIRARIASITLRYNGDDDETAEDRAVARQEPEERRRTLGNLREQLIALRRERDQTNDRSALRRIGQEIADINARIQRISEKDNTVTAVLSYPRSGESSLMAHRPLNIPGDNEPLPLPDEFLESVLFKEEVQGETVLQIHVTDKDRNNGFLRFLRRVISATFSSLAGEAIKGISEVLVNKTADNLSGQIASAIKGSDDKNRVISLARSARVEITVAADGSIAIEPGRGGTFEGGLLTLPLVASRDFRDREIPGGLDTGEPIGQIVLGLEAEALA